MGSEMCIRDSHTSLYSMFCVQLAVIFNADAARCQNVNKLPSLLYTDTMHYQSLFVTPTLPAPCGVVASARLCCLSRVPLAVCPSLLESATTVCTSLLRSLSTYVHAPTPHSILRFRPAPQTPDLRTSNLPLVRRNFVSRIQ